MSESWGLKLTKLWENAAPKSNFAAQDITCDLSSYELFILVYDVQNSIYAGTVTTYMNSYKSMILKKGKNVLESFGILGANFITRLVTVDDSGIVFGNGYWTDSANATTLNLANIVNVPITLYGLYGI